MERPGVPGLVLVWSGSCDLRGGDFHNNKNIIILKYQYLYIEIYFRRLFLNVFLQTHTVLQTIEIADK